VPMFHVRWAKSIHKEGHHHGYTQCLREERLCKKRAMGTREPS
jgi:hypothetical protein